MRLIINGEERDLPDGLTVADLLDQLALPTSRVAVEVNKDLVPRARHAAHTLRADDHVEVVTMVGGG
ncbi:MAG: sulfur carrier protein ThiS [Planctomycetota bacterium]